MAKQSAGILLYRKTEGKLQVFLVHPGGPFFKNKDEGNWSIPKGEFLDEEDPLEAAKREFKEETGQAIAGKFILLNPITQKSGKKVHAWAVEGDMDHLSIKSNQFEMEWPPRSGKQQSFPEVDRAEWFDMDIAKVKINPAQAGFIEELVETIGL
ncbi:Predicted NTP pyrophosphohydrolase, NUDIX family [Mucilaginibacter lappiensis]|uniref:NUDIX family NTP pyrophosphohydrolase n=1 Tax=Mucilaginibacter lappiensis TaxID=354630 RepID=A0ABR6PPL2_9SPHI|nr:NUDIX domain-containing protein [Mucilaginibacter lappiensis]MBB6111134.1 putative NUDIX family NTP pyrophosphohydrolase [Mucilaginibacter lappiensis]SIR69991.1 Predicted NTP pyrophosphohydrolase, NUDIX family [Mucilaginibacter lappiensis]